MKLFCAYIYFKGKKPIYQMYPNKNSANKCQIVPHASKSHCHDTKQKP